MNVKGTKKKNQVVIANIFEQQELLKKAEVIRESLTVSTWHELETNGKFDKNKKEGSDCSVRRSKALFILEPCLVSDDSEIGQGSGEKPDNDGVREVLHQHNDQQAKKQGKRPRNTRTL